MDIRLLRRLGGAASRTPAHTGAHLRHRRPGGQYEFWAKRAVERLAPSMPARAKVAAGLMKTSEAVG
jgi:hypothetical protein